MAGKYTNTKREIEIDGVSMRKLYSQLDRTLTGRDRIDLISNIFYREDGMLNDYIVDVMDGSSGGKDYVETNITVNSPLSEDVQFFKYLDSMANYILYDDENSNKVFTADNLDRKTNKENEGLIEKHSQNLKKSMKLKNIPKKYLQEDVGKGYELLLPYQEAITIMDKKTISWRYKKIRPYDAILKDGGKLLPWEEEEYKIIKPQLNKEVKIRNSLKSCQLETFELIHKPLIFKNPLSDSPSHDYSGIDFNNKEHLFALLHFNLDKEYMSDSLDDNILVLKDKINKCNFDETKRDILFFLQKNYKKKEIAEELGTTYQNVQSHVESIMNEIIKIYNSDYEDWFYLFKEKGQYKTCSKCGEILLISKFRDGRGECQKCELTYQKVDKKICTKCAKTKAFSAFGVDSRKSDGLKSVCRECDSEATRLRRLDKMIKNLNNQY